MNEDRPRRSLYPPVEPRKTGRLAVSALHELYWEESGHPDGLPVIALHGGPGGGSSPEMRRFFDPRRYRIIMFDQRGCGRSTPHSELRENTTWDLVRDIETLRAHLGVKKWLVFGGSWGSTLALAYAAMHRKHVLGLLLRGIFLLKESEIRWFYQEGASNIFPDAFDRYVTPIPRGRAWRSAQGVLQAPDRQERRRARRSRCRLGALGGRDAVDPGSAPAPAAL